MKDRIIQFIESEKISAAEFADRIGVQRSSVSHVLNGRNNPGFSFIQKILETYPKINSRWLLLGEGEIYLDDNQKRKSTSIQSNLFEQSENELVTVRKSVSDQTNNATRQALTENTHLQNFNSEVVKKVTRVLIFYDDQTFHDYTPSK